MSKYSLKLVEGKKTFNEEIEIDTEKETETFHVPKTSPDEEAGDIIYDFKRVKFYLIYLLYAHGVGNGWKWG